ncbi:MAG TPA: class II fructose-bisphosphate aldolase [Candidatus Anammoximicrobium sp.]|nr:class II fructose-bisphosphate aldolase [Candidatus Anammoximicrobium sp.]
MPLVNPLGMLQAARQGGYCVGAFNLVDYLTTEAIVQAAEAKRSPVILQTSSATVKRFGIENIVQMARMAAENSPVPVALHLDHGTDPKVISEAIRSGYTSVMFDGSKYPLQENAARTRKIVDEAHANGLSVEGEIGVVAGVEDDIVIHQDKAIYTTPDEALEFRRLSGVDFLAAAIGTAHGFYKVQPRLDIDTLRKLSHTTECPMVVHGGTGLPEDVVRELVAAGAAKMNVSTQIKQTYIDGLHGYIEAHRTEYNPLKLLDHARQELLTMIGRYMEVFGSAGRVER